MSETPFVAGNGALYVQVNGPNTKPEYLGCHDLDDVTQPERDKTLIWCRDPSAPKMYRVVGSYQGGPGVITTSIVTLLQKSADWLETIRCPATLFANMVKCGKVDIFDNWARSFILEKADISLTKLSKLVTRAPGDEGEVTQTFAVKAEALHSALEVHVDRQEINETEDLSDITFCNSPTCQDECGVSKDYCQDGYVTSAAQAGSPADVADVLITEDGGVDGWPGTPADPFAAGMDITGVTCFEVGNGVTRVIVARGTADAGPMDVAYSDDRGTTWTGVEVGATNGQYATRGGTLFSLDMYHIWLVTTGGYIYFSEDGGLTWAAQTEGTLSANNLNHIDFADDLNGVAVGDSNTILQTDDGGETWAAVAGPADQAGLDIVTVDVRDEYRWWIGYTTDGELWFTEDGGDTWEERDFHPDNPTDALMDISFANDLVGYFVTHWSYLATVGGEIYETINGGYSWKNLDTPTNQGLNVVYVCGDNLAYAVGDSYGGTGVVFKVSA
jgi:photosystem II stability/assembly factor-like uncharacterized protein